MSTPLFVKVDQSASKHSSGTFRRVFSDGSSEPLTIWRGNGATWNIGIFRDEEDPVDLSGLASLKVQIQPAIDSTTGAAYVTKTVTSGSITNTITKANFDSGSAYHAQVTFDDADLNIDPGAGNTTKSIWLVVFGTTSGGNEVTFGAANITLYEDGTAASPGSPPGVDPAIDADTAIGLIEARLGKTYTGTIADGSLTGTVTFGETLTIDSGSIAGVTGAYQVTSGKNATPVMIKPGSLTTTQVEVEAQYSDHGGINVSVAVIP